MLISEENEAHIEEITKRVWELHELETKRKILLAEMNVLASKITYSPDDVDAALHWEQELDDAAYQAGVGFYSHKPGKLNTFWIPSAGSC